jgi:hypothetical protein
MADINLLGVENQKTNFARTGAGLAVKVLVAIVIIVIGYYIYLRVQINRTRSAIKSAQAQTEKAKADALANKDRGELLTRQGQLQSLDKLIKGHLYWSGLLPELAGVTLKSSSYASFKADAAGTLTLDVLVPTYADADKYLQIFNLPEFNKQFSDVKVIAITKVQQETSVQIDLNLQLKFNPEFIRKTW